MMITCKQFLATVAVAGALTVTAANAQTSSSAGAVPISGADDA